MKLAAVVGICAAVAASVPMTVLASDGGAAPDVQVEAALDLSGPTNAALRHFRAWGMTSTEHLATFRALYEKESELTPGWSPSAEMRDALAGLEGYVSLSLRAAQLAEADWGIEYGDGWMALLPHLSKLREEARVLETTARAILAGGDATQRPRAIECLAAIFRIAGHTRRDRTMISTLVGGAIAARGSAVVTALIEQRRLTPADAPAILEGLSSLTGADPFNLVATFRIEQHLGATLFDKRGPEAGHEAAEVAREMTLMTGQAPADDGVVTALRGMDEAALRADVAKQGAFYREAERSVRAGGPGVAGALADLERRAATGEFGVTIKIIAPSLGKAFGTDLKNREAVAKAAAALRAMR